MPTLENKRNDIITLAKGAEVHTYVPQVHEYNMIHIYIYICDEQENRVQGARNSEYNLENCKNAYKNTVMKVIEQINEYNNGENKINIRIDNIISYIMKHTNNKSISMFAICCVTVFCIAISSCNKSKIDIF